MPALTVKTPITDYYKAPAGKIRVINFTVDRSSSDVNLGFNVRGGAEFGLGIYISGVSEGSIAESAGFQVGDEIIAINGTSFEGFTHEEAVHFITSTESLSVTVRSTGRIPEEEQFIGKPSWIDNNGDRIVDYPVDDIAFATEDLYPDNGSDDSLPVYDQRNLNIPVYSQEITRYPLELKTSQESMQTKPPSKMASHSSKQKDSGKSKRKGKKSGKKQKISKGSTSSRNSTPLNDQRDQLLNVVMDRLLLEFTVNECKTIRQSIVLYHEGEAVEELLNHILRLFTPKKYELLREIRKVIYADEVEKYDALVSGYLQRMMIEQTKRRELANKGFEPDSEPPPPPPPPPPPAPQAAPVPEVKSIVVAAPEVKSTNEIVMQPVKTSYKKKDSAKVNPQKVKESTLKHPPDPSTAQDNVIVMKPVTHPSPQRDVIEEPEPAPSPVVEQKYEQPTIKPFVPFVPEPYVLYDKDKNPVQKLVHGVRLPANSVKVVPGPEVNETPATPAEPAPVIVPAPTRAPVAVPAPTPQEVAPVRKVVKKVETTEVRTKGRKESIEVSKKGTKDNTVVSVHKTSVDSDNQKTLLTIQKSSFDEASNTITIDATLNLDKSLPKINSVPVNDSVDGKVIVAVPVSVEKSIVAPVAQDSSVIVESPALESAVKEPIITVEKSPVVVPEVEQPVVTVEKRSTVVTNSVVTVEKSPVEPDHSDLIPTPVVVPVVKDPSPNPIAVRNSVKVSLEGKRTFDVDKSHKLIGLSISGGSDSRYQREIRIVNVAVGSAASAAGLEVGSVLLAVDDHSLADSTHAEACHLIRSTFRDKTNGIMVLKVE